MSMSHVLPTWEEQKISDTAPLCGLSVALDMQSILPLLFDLPVSHLIRKKKKKKNGAN